MHYGDHVHWAPGNPQIVEPPAETKWEGTFGYYDHGLGEWVEEADED